MDDDPWADAPSSPRPPSITDSPTKSSQLPGPSKLKQESPNNDISSKEDGENGLEADIATSPIEKMEKVSISDEFDDQFPSSSEADFKTENSATFVQSGEKEVNENSNVPVQVDQGNAEENDGFDDFDDFDSPQTLAGPSSSNTPTTNFVSAGDDGADDEGFGDFGDFEEGDFEESAPEAGAGHLPVESIPEEPVKERWSALTLRPFPPKSELLNQLTELLSPLKASSEAGPSSSSSSILNDDGLRMVGGFSQIMVTESSRDVYAQLTTAPMLKPLDWTRSRVRRDHLISMGVPVNLDEVDSHRLTSLPPLRITTGDAPQRQPIRSGSLDSGRTSISTKGKEREREGAREIEPRSAGGINGSTRTTSTSNRKNGGKGKYGLGDKPELDISKAEDLCGLEEDRLSIMSLANLKKLQHDLVTTSAQASTLLAWQLQFKDAQTQDSATYNGMISELIANAAKAKSAQQTGSGGGVFRRSSQRVSSLPMGRASGVGGGGGSGTSTPRIGSPALR